MNHIKLVLRYGSNNLTRQYIINRKILNYLNFQICYNSTLENFLNQFKEKDDFLNKIIYNEVLNTAKLKGKEVSQSNEPIFLRFLLEEEHSKVKEENNEESEILHFPYQSKKTLPDEHENVSSMGFLPKSLREFTPAENEGDKEFEWSSKLFRKNLRNLEQPHKWMNIDNDGLEIDDTDTKFEFGSYNPNKAVSTVPCGGCGALLHCNDPAIPGFIPFEAFQNKTKEELRGEICQRCVFLRDLDVALGVNVKPSEYSKIISAVKEKEAMVILMIDMLDFPCSIHPEILDLIGTKPIVIVGNKVDLLIQDGPWFLDHFKKSLIASLTEQNINLENVKHISLISAKTGYGVEDLIDILYNNWDYKGDIYLIGCTNAGKSTFFNALIQSDFCKVKAVNVLQRATVSTWPGTTLNLLKFPIARPSRSRLYVRAHRLRIERKEMENFQKFQWLGQNLKLEQIPLRGFVSRTGEEQMVLAKSDEDLKKGLNPADPEFTKGFWFYDTPGVVHEDQIINFLTTAELLLTVPRKMLLPRNFHLRPGQSLFIGGLARLDYIRGADLVWFTVFASMDLPLTVTKLEDADHVYEKLLGSPLFRVPMKGKERLSKWPKLSSKKLEIVGKSPSDLSEKSAQGKPIKEADADVVLSSAGWVSVTVPTGHRCSIEAWTPEGRGIHLRDIPLIKTGYAFRGQKIWKTPAFTTVVKEVEGRSLTEDPPPNM